MKKILFIDGCIRGEQSRTKIIADAFFAELSCKCKFDLQTVVLDKTDILPLGKKEYERRENLLAQNRLDDPTFDLAKQFAAADIIVVAAPFWDMGIPAKLKTYFEHVSVSGFTFKCTEEGCKGLCSAKKMAYITTRGMQIEDGSVMEQASPYLFALTKFFGIGGFDTVSAYGLDVDVNNVDGLVAEAVQKAKVLADNIADCL